MAKEKKENDGILDVSEELLKEWGRQVNSGADILAEEVKVNSTGSTKLDWALGKSFVDGSINEFYGANGTGKTTLALEVAANATQAGKHVFFFDLERKLSRAQVEMIPRIKKELFYRIRPDTGEDAVNKLVRCVSEVPSCVCIFDSLTQLLPEVEDAEDAEKQQMGAVARLAAKMVRKINGPVERNRCMVLFISHITTNMSPYAGGDTTKGGKAVPDIAAQRVRLSRTQADLIKDAGGNVVGQMTTCKIIKNNQSLPFREVQVPIMYGKGIDKPLDLLQIARDLTVIEYKNGWYMYAEKEGEEPKRKRESEMMEILNTNKEYRESVIAKVKELL